MQIKDLVLDPGLYVYGAQIYTQTIIYMSLCKCVAASSDILWFGLRWNKQTMNTSETVISLVMS